MHFHDCCKKYLEYAGLAFIVDMSFDGHIITNQLHSLIIDMSSNSVHCLKIFMAAPNSRSNKISNLCIPQLTIAC